MSLPVDPNDPYNNYSGNKSYNPAQPPPAYGAQPYGAYGGAYGAPVGQAYGAPQPYGGQPYAPPQAAGYGAPTNPYGQPQGYAPTQEVNYYGQPPPHQYTATGVDYSAQPLAENGGEGEKFAETSYRDPIWAALFLIHFLVMFIAGFAMFGNYKSELTSKGAKDSGSSEFVNGDLYGSIVIFILMGGGVCVMWLWMMRHYAKSLIWFTLYFSVAIQLFFSIVLFAAGNVGGGVVFLLFALLSCVYIYFVRGRIPFASAMLEIVGGVVNLFPSTIYFSLGAAVIQGVWMLLWAVFAVSIVYSVDYGHTSTTTTSSGTTSTTDRGSSGTVNFVWVLLVLSYFWTSQVIKNIVHVTTAGLLASWYFLYPAQMPQNPTVKAFKRATTTSLGSICLGSLVIAVLKTIRYLVQQSRRSNNDLAHACAECLISIIDRLVQYFNMYAFTQVAIYGKTYIEAAKATWELLKRRGFDAVINDDLIGGVIMMGALLGAFVVGAVGLILGKYVFGYSDNWGVFVLIGVLIGLSMTVSAMEVIESGVAALFVCYAEDPRVLQETKPDAFNSLTGGLQQYYPSTCVAPQPQQQA